MVVVAAGEIFRSTDGGVTYTSNTNGIAGQAVTDLVSDPGVTTRLYAAEGGKVYKSDDTGASWTGKSPPALASRCWRIRASSSPFITARATTWFMRL